MDGGTERGKGKPPTGFFEERVQKKHQLYIKPKLCSSIYGLYSPSNDLAAAILMWPPFLRHEVVGFILTLVTSFPSRHMAVRLAPGCWRNEVGL